MPISVELPADWSQATPLVTAWRELAAQEPDRPVLTHEGRTVTRSQFDQLTDRLAQDYRRRGVGPDAMVTVALPNGIEFFAATMAAWKAGATPQPVSARAARPEVEATVELADSALVAGYQVAGRTCLGPGYQPPSDLPAEPLPVHVAASFKAPTSGGSTGRPKLIVSGAPAVVEAPLLGAMLYQLEPGWTHLVTGPLYHNGPFSCAFGSLLTGGHLVVMTRFDAETALQLLERYRVDHMYLVPTMMQRIWRLPVEVRDRYDISSLKVAYHLAAPCPPWLKEAWIEWLGPERIWELYGGTEQQVITVIRGDEWLAHRGSVGRPTSGGRIRILDPVTLADLPPGEVGEVFLKRAEGRPETYRYVGAEPRVGPDGFESLGDMGYVDADGYLYLTDRRNDMILVGGANVYPAEVEAALDSHPCVRSSVVIGIPDEEYGGRVHALVQLDGEVTDDDLRAFLGERLTAYKIPRSFERVTDYLRDDAGKVRRSALRAERIQPG